MKAVFETRELTDAEKKEYWAYKTKQLKHEARMLKYGNRIKKFGRYALGGAALVGAGLVVKSAWDNSVENRVQDELEAAA